MLGQAGFDDGVGVGSASARTLYATTDKGLVAHSQDDQYVTVTNIPAP